MRGTNLTHGHICLGPRKRNCFNCNSLTAAFGRLHEQVLSNANYVFLCWTWTIFLSSPPNLKFHSSFAETKSAFTSWVGLAVGDGWMQVWNITATVYTCIGTMFVPGQGKLQQKNLQRTNYYLKYGVFITTKCVREMEIVLKTRANLGLPLALIL